MNIIALTPIDLGLAALLLIALALLVGANGMKTGLGFRILIAALRASVQLTIVGLVLKALFDQVQPLLMALLALFMLVVAAREIMARQEMGFSGGWAFGIGALSMFLSSFLITLFALTIIISPTPWYTPQYAIPLLGMLLGNTMTGISVALDRLTREVVRERGAIEARLLLGHSWKMALRPFIKEAIRAGMIPSLNAMSVAGLVTLPGMMTGQILAGNPPSTAATYQIMILFLIVAGTGFGTSMGVWIAGRRLFDGRQRIRLDRLKNQ